MRRTISLLLLALLGAAAIACGTSGRDLRPVVEGAPSPTRSVPSTIAAAGPLSSAVAATFALSSPGFAEGQPIPAEYSCTGPSPALAWTGIPAGTKELALVVIDYDADNFVHWMVTGIPATAGSTPKGQAPKGGTQFLSSSGKIGWHGPCPPPASKAHTYTFTLFALDSPSAIPAGTSPNDALAALQKQVTDGGGSETVLTGTFPAGTAGTNGTAGPGGTDAASGDAGTIAPAGSLGAPGTATSR